MLIKTYHSPEFRLFCSPTLHPLVFFTFDAMAHTHAFDAYRTMVMVPPDSIMSLYDNPMIIIINSLLLLLLINNPLYNVVNFHVYRNFMFCMIDFLVLYVKS